jgi:hypothetical protein
MTDRFVALRIATALVAGFLASNPAIAAETGAPTSEAYTPSQPTQAQTPQKSKIDPRVEQLLNRSCEDLASNKAFTFHAEITFEQGVTIEREATVRGRRELRRSAPQV